MLINVWLERSYDPPECHPGQHAYTFVIRILSTSLTSVLFSLSAVTLGIYLCGPRHSLCTLLKGRVSWKVVSCRFTTRLSVATLAAFPSKPSPSFQRTLSTKTILVRDSLRRRVILPWSSTGLNQFRLCVGTMAFNFVTAFWYAI